MYGPMWIDWVICIIATLIFVIWTAWGFVDYFIWKKRMGKQEEVFEREMVGRFEDGD